MIQQAICSLHFFSICLVTQAHPRLLPLGRQCRPMAARRLVRCGAERRRLATGAHFHTLVRVYSSTRILLTHDSTGTRWSASRSTSSEAARCWPRRQLVEDSRKAHSFDQVVHLCVSVCTTCHVAGQLKRSSRVCSAVQLRGMSQVWGCTLCSKHSGAKYFLHAA